MCFYALDCYLANQISTYAYSENYRAQQLLYKILLYLSITCIVVPIFVAIVQLIRQTQRTWWRKSNLKGWLAENARFLYFISILAGSSFTAIDLMTSNVFGLTIFSFDLSKRDRIMFKRKRIYSIVLLENIPQLLIQIAFAILIKDIDTDQAITDPIVISAVCELVLLDLHITVCTLVRTWELQNRCIDAHMHSRLKCECACKQF